MREEIDEGISRKLEILVRYRIRGPVDGLSLQRYKNISFETQRGKIQNTIMHIYSEINRKEIG